MFQRTEIIMYWYDYVVLIVMIAVSIFIGIYFGIFGKKQSTSEYLMGNRRMKPFPVGCSAVASVISSVSLVGVPSEVYQYGATLLLAVITTSLGCLVSCVLFLPVLFKLKITSIYEYLNRRFDERTRKFVALLFVLCNFTLVPGIIYLTVIILSPAVGISFHWLVPIISGICIFYTTIGGFKTVVWTDTLQLVFMFASIILILILGIKSSEYDLRTIWSKAVEGDRLNVFDFDFNPTKRDTFWTLIIGFTVYTVSYSILNQNHMQKIMSVQTFRESVIAEIYYAIGKIIIYPLSCLTGLVMYAKYSGCDPVQAGKIRANDQLVLLYVTDVAQSIPGFTGIFLAGIVSAALSTQSAVLNSIAGVIHEDFLKDLLDRSNVTEKRRNILVKLLVLVLGVASTLLVFVIIHFKTSIFAYVLSFNGIVCGANLGVFTLGILFPIANAKGAFYGSICGFLSTAFIVIPAKYYQYNGFWNYPHKPVSTANCTFANDTQIYEVMRNKTNFELTEFHPPAIFRISFYYYSTVGFIVTMVFGLLISYLTKHKNHPPTDKSLLSPLTRYFESKKNNIVHKNVAYSTIQGAFNGRNMVSPENSSEIQCLK